MERRSLLRNIAVGLLTCSAAGYFRPQNDSHFRVRMHVERQDASGQLHQASSLLQVVTDGDASTALNPGMSTTLVYGRAVSFATAQGLLMGIPLAPYSLRDLGLTIIDRLAPAAHFPAWQAREPGFDVLRTRWIGAHAGEGLRADLPRMSEAGYGRCWPLFMLCSNPAQPALAREIDPLQAGVRRIWLETTRDPMPPGD
jgi:hypothetical protein